MISNANNKDHHKYMVFDSDKVIGVNLPLYQTDFSIFHSDGVRVKINEGFLKEDEK